MLAHAADDVSSLCVFRKNCTSAGGFGSELRIAALRSYQMRHDESARFVLASHSGCCGFGNTLGALETSFLLAVITGRMWVTNSIYFHNRWLLPSSPAYSPEAMAPHELASSAAARSGLHERRLPSWSVRDLEANHLASFPELKRERVLPSGRALLSRHTNNTVVLVHADREHMVGGWIHTVVAQDAAALQRLRELYSLVAPASRAASVSVSVPAMVLALRGALVRHVLCAQPAPVVRQQLALLRWQLLRAAAAWPPARCRHREDREWRGTDVAALGDAPSFDGVLGVQVRTWKDSSSYNASKSIGDELWPCVIAAARALRGRLAPSVAPRPPRVLVWLTSDDMPRVSAEFYAALAPAAEATGFRLATPDCPPTPAGGQAQDSRKGDVSALAHWWALGASDAAVVGGSTYSYSAWLRSTDAEDHDEQSSQWYFPHCAAYLKEARVQWHSRTRWR